MNFLEQLASEWYEYSGYFVRTNVKARRLPHGGWGMEVDVLAYEPHTKLLLHIEPTSDADSWPERKKRFLTKKFILSHGEYEEIVGAQISKVRKIAIVGYGHYAKVDLNWGDDIEVVLIPLFIKQIATKLKGQHPAKEAVPEGYPILRGMQMMLAYGMQVS
jgi:hypothetical protein